MRAVNGLRVLITLKNALIILLCIIAKHRLDQLATMMQNCTPTFTRALLKYPFDKLKSIRLTAGVRTDKYVITRCR